MSSTLRDEIALREASIADARRELADGEMTEEHFAALEARERAAIARCEEALREVGPDTTAPVAPGPRRHRRGLLYAAFVCFGIAVVGALVAALALRQPGDSVTGGVSLSTAQRVSAYLAEGEIDQATNDDTAALAAYASALSLDPTNVEALTQSGWLEFTAGSAAGDVAAVRLGEQRIEKAVDAVPTDPAPRLYYAIVVASTPGQRSLAVREFRLFLSLKPTSTELATARPWLEELGLATR